MTTKTIYIKDIELIRWIEEEIKKGNFRNFSHAVELALRELRDLRTNKGLSF